MTFRILRLPLLLWLLALSAAIFAQKTPLTPELANSPRLAPRGIARAAWRDAGSFTYLPAERNRLVAWQTDGKTEDLIQLKDFATSLDNPPANFPALTWIDADRAWFVHANRMFIWQVSTQTATAAAELPLEDIQQMEFSPRAGVAYTREHNLWVIGAPGETARQLTRDGTRELTYGEAAHRSEFGITKGLFWSPSGRKLAFYRMDQSMVTDYPLFTFNDRPGKQTLVKYPFAGDKSHHVTIGIYTDGAESPIYLKTTGPAEQYLTNITWSPDEQTVYVAIVNRDQNEMSLRTYDATTGAELATLFSETHPKYVEPEHGPVFLPDGKSFLWHSERDGFNHLYQYDLRGKLMRQVTSGQGLVTEVLGFDEKGKTVYVAATFDSPLEIHLYAVEVNSGKMVRLTREPGVHRGTLSPDGKWIIDQFSNPSTPNKTVLLSTDPKIAPSDVFAAPNPVEKYALGGMRLLTLKATDGTPLYARMITPPDFDSTKTYPAIVYVYGGPHAQMVTNSWLMGGNLFFHYLAQQGFVVFTLDNRGSANRGLAFEQAIHRNLGSLEVDDQMAGVNYLRSLPYIDSERLGVHGWSYGGFMTISMLLKRPGVFKAGVAGGPVIDWKMYEVMYGERYMDRPEENPEGYRQASLLSHVDSLDAPLLIIHGQQDDVVVPQHSTEFVQACIEQRKQVDYFPYPTHPHNVIGPDRAHLFALITRYFLTHL